jgi:hypothetical protein
MSRPAYSIVIANERYKTTKLVKFFFILLNAFAIIYVSLATDQPKRMIWAILAIIVLIGSLFPRKNIINKLFARSSIAAYIWLAIGWMALENYWMLIAVIVFAAINSMLKERYEIKFFENLVTINTFPVKQIKWFELNNAMLKDRLLTIDFRNDKLIQSQIIQLESDADDEDQFNNYCQQQLKTHSLAF